MKLPNALIGPTDFFITERYDAHVMAWRWYCTHTGNYHYWPKYSNRIVYGRKEK
jgi:hypothetical protein